MKILSSLVSKFTGDRQTLAQELFEQDLRITMTLKHLTLYCTLHHINTCIKTVQFSLCAMN